MIAPIAAIDMDRGVRAAAVLVAVLLALFPRTGATWESARKADSAPIVFGISNAYPPFGYVDRGGAPRGFSVDLMQALGREMKRPVSFLAHPEYRQLLDWAKTGRIDVRATILRETPDTYSVPVLTLKERIFVLGDRTDIRGIDDLAGKTAACVNGHVSYYEFIKKFPAIRCYMVNSVNEAVSALSLGFADMFVFQEKTALHVGKNLSIPIVAVGNPTRELKWALAVSSANGKLLHSLDQALENIRASGELQEIRDRWFGKKPAAGIFDNARIDHALLAAIAIAMIGGVAFFFAIRGIRLQKAKTEAAVRAIAEREKEVERTARVLACVNSLHSGQDNPDAAGKGFEESLKAVLDMTGSEFGAICRIVGEIGAPDATLRSLAIAGRDDAEGMPAFLRARGETHLEVPLRRNLLGEAVLTGLPVFVNDVAADPRRGGFPPEHPPMKTFLGLPLANNGEVVGLLVLANAPGGYDERVVGVLLPILLASAGGIRTVRDHDTLQAARRDIAARDWQLHAMLDSVADTILAIDDRGLVQSINRAGERTFGYAAAEIVGSPFQVLLAALDFECDFVAEFLARRSTLPPSISRETTGRRRDGGTFPMDIAISRAATEKGILYSAIIRDVTDRRRVETALRKSQEELSRTATDLRRVQRHIRDALESIKDGVILFDAQERIVMWNESFKMASGSVPLAVGEPFSKMIRDYYESGRYVDADDSWLERRIEAFRRLEPFEFSQRFESGGQRVLVNHYLTHDGGTFLVRTDVTERHRAEEALRQSQQRLFDAIASLNDGVILYDAEERVVLFNEAYRRAFAYVADLLQPGATFESLLRALLERGHYIGKGPDFIEERLRKFRNLEPLEYKESRPTGDRWIAVHHYRTKDGGTFLVRIDTTDQRMTEDAAETAQQRLLDTIDGLSDGAVLYDADERIVLFNETFRRAYSHVADIIRPGTDFGSVVRILLERGHYIGKGPDFAEERLRKFRNLEPLEYQERCPDGDRWTAVRHYRTREGGIFMVLTDVTEQKKIENAAKTAQQRLFDAIDSLSDGVILYDADERIVLFNEAFRQAHAHVADVIRPDVKFEDAVRTLLERGHFIGKEPDFIAERLRKFRDLEPLEFKESRPTGDRWISIRHYRTRDDGTFVVLVDVTEQKKIENAAKTAQQRLFDAIENTTDDFLLLDADDRFVACNSKYTRRNPGIADMLVPGTPFAAIILGTVETGLYADTNLYPADWMKFRMANHGKNYRTPFEIRARGGGVLMIREFKAADGGTIVLRTDITEIKNAEAALKQSEARLSTALRLAQIADWRMDLANGAFLWGEGIWPLFGLPPTTSPSLDALIPLIHPDDRDRTQAVLEGALQKGRRYEIEFRIVRADDTTIRIIRSEAVEEKDETGAIVRLIGFCQDVSERREWETLIRKVAQGLSGAVGEPYLQSLAARLAEVLAADMSIVGLLDGEGKDSVRAIGTWRDGLLSEGMTYRLSNTPCKSAIDFGTLDVQDDLHELYPNDEDLIREGFRAYVGRRLDDPAGKPLGLLAVLSRRPLVHAKLAAALLDIFAGRAAAELERVRVESALRESERKFRVIADFTYDWESWLDTAGNPLWISPSISRVAGVSASEAMEMPDYPYALTHPDDRANLRAALAKPMGSHFEFRLTHKDGLPRWAAASWTHIADAAGTNAGLRLSIRDITETKAMEANMIQATKLATLGEMASGLAHEMSQPLNIIQLAAGGAILEMNRGATADEIREKFDLIASQTQRMGEIIDHVRIFSRRDSGAAEPFSPVAAVRSAVQMTAPQYRIDDIEIVLDTPAVGAIRVRGSRVQLEQVMLNLIGNARDSIVASRETNEDKAHTGRIRIALSQMQNGRIRIVVEDNGTGFSDDDLPRIFDPFFTTKAPGKGTGLGLSISYNIVAGMGGTFAASNIDGGARIEIMLPIESATIPAKLPPATSPQPEPAASDAPHPVRHVLVVDDEPDAAHGMADLLSHDKFRVSIAHDGIEAMRMFKRDPADLVITDIRMPKSDGHGLIRKLSKLRPAPPILVVTGHLGFTETLSRKSRTSSLSILRKPVSPETLLCSVRDLLGNSRRHSDTLN